MQSMYRHLSALCSPDSRAYAPPRTQCQRAHTPMWGVRTHVAIRASAKCASHVEGGLLTGIDWA